MKWLLIGIMMLPIFGLWLLGLWVSAGYFLSSNRFAPQHSREVFGLGYEAGVLGRRPETSSKATLQAA